jgi:L-fuconate dehydratase
MTDSDAQLTGCGFVLTIGRGNDVEVAAIKAVTPMIIGKDVAALLSNMGATWRSLVYDSPFALAGPEKCVMHMAIGAVVNALWDLKSKLAGLPLWRLLAQMTPEELVDLVDFRYLTDALTRDEALAILQAALDGRERREAHRLKDGYPAYTTTPGGLGYDDAKLERLCREAVADGFTQIKLKVGANVDDDIRRLEIARAAVGPDIALATEANQRWDVDDAVKWIAELSRYDLAWVEERPAPTISSAMPRSPVRSIPCRWQRENMSPTG